MNRRFAGILILAALWLGGAAPGGSAEELRGLWVDTFHPALRNDGEVRQLVAEARAGGFNALFVEVRKRGDAYYESRHEPTAADVAPGFDPLGRLLELAHDTRDGRRLGVHAWIVAFNIWNQPNNLPPQANHPFRLHPEWLTRSVTGATWDGANYAFDPGHPEVQEHTFQVAMDLIRRYDLDGLHWDYIRYAGREWGYHEVALQRFNTLYQRTGRPASDDPEWLQFRRDQVTALVRRVYLHALAEKPDLVISAATIAFAPGISTTAEWPSSAAYSQVLQDWRAWMEEGILDWNVPMLYFRQTEHAAALSRWLTFSRAHQYRRQTAAGLGFYLNTASNALGQVRLAREGAVDGRSLAGVSAYSYAALATDLGRAALLEALVRPSSIDPGQEAVFGDPADPPSAPWKRGSATGHLLGYVRDLVTGFAIDGARLRCCGPTNRLLIADARGCFGAVDLPAGDYRIVAEAPGYGATTESLTVRGAGVAQVRLDLRPVDPEEPGDVRISTGAREAVVSWRSRGPATGGVRLGHSPCTAEREVAAVTSGTRHTVWLGDLQPGTDYRLEIVSHREGVDYVSGTLDLRTAGEVVIDNSEAWFSGGWTLAATARDRWGVDYRQAGTVRTSSVPALARWEARLATPGRYAIEAWIPSAGNRSQRARYEVGNGVEFFPVEVDQSRAGGSWLSLIPDGSVTADGVVEVRLRNHTGEAGRWVVADAVRWRYLEDQDVPRPDRLPAWWAGHFFGPAGGGAVPPGADSDGDGLTNGAERLVGTDPTDGQSFLVIGLVPAAGSAWRIRFRPRLEGRAYRLEVRSIEMGSNWEVAATNEVAEERGWGAFEVAGKDLDGRLFRVAVRWP